MSNPASLRKEFWSLPAEAMVDRPTIAAAFYLSPASLDAMAIKGGGPAYTRVGRRALYSKAEALEWAQRTGRHVENTAQLAGRGTVMSSTPAPDQAQDSSARAVIISRLAALGFSVIELHPLMLVSNGAQVASCADWRQAAAFADRLEAKQ
jgi:hypothetical protein